MLDGTVREFWTTEAEELFKGDGKILDHNTYVEIGDQLNTPSQTKSDEHDLMITATELEK